MEFFVLTNLLFLFQVLSFFQGLFTFYHQGYELAKDFNHYKMALQINIQNVSRVYFCELNFSLKLLQVLRLYCQYLVPCDCLASEFWGYGAISWITNHITGQIGTNSSEFFGISNNTVKNKHEVKGPQSFFFLFFFFERNNARII